ncbi:hypothetical protein CASFOL_022382 [Castilleja foliolosa]|uniref:FAD-dependent oxidoreductase 2 FAD-binding domain-containing protein n=1 Tax=Castilleja foliolosa TaxID=1961234 RepID=A0ABD3CUG4_9LAMI
MATSVASGGGQLHFIDTGFKGRGCRQAYGLHNISVPKCSQKDISWSPGVFKSLRINKNNYLLHQSKENNNLKQIRASCLRDGYSKYFDFAVIGSGVAGLCYALEVAKYGTVAVITKAEPHENKLIALPPFMRRTFGVLIDPDGFICIYYGMRIIGDCARGEIQRLWSSTAPDEKRAAHLTPGERGRGNGRYPAARARAANFGQSAAEKATKLIVSVSFTYGSKPIGIENNSTILASVISKDQDANSTQVLLNFGVVIPQMIGTLVSGPLDSLFGGGFPISEHPAHWIVGSFRGPSASDSDEPHLTLQLFSDQVHSLCQTSPATHIQLSLKRSDNLGSTGFSRIAVHLEKRSEIDLKRLRSSSLSKDESGTTIEARFTHFCKNDIRLDDNMLEQSTELFDESKNLLIANISALGNDTLDEAESVLVCICAILGEKV